MPIESIESIQFIQLVRWVQSIQSIQAIQCTKCIWFVVDVDLILPIVPFQKWPCSECQRPTNTLALIPHRIQFQTLRKLDVAAVAVVAASTADCSFEPSRDIKVSN